jgi:hypothetical protein
MGVTYTSPSKVFFALTMDEHSLPVRAPTLPPEITHIWLMNTQIDRGIGWSPDRAWFDPIWHWATG